MPDEWIDQPPYGKLQLAIDDDVAWFALAPDATLNDIADLFHVTAGGASCRLLSVRVMIQSVPQHHFTGDQ